MQSRAKCTPSCPRWAELTPPSPPTSQSLARLGATTLAIDASAANILTAQAHAAQDPVFDLVNAAIPTAAAASSSPSAGRHSLEYRHCAAEDLVKEGRQFDVVCSMEVIEHVEDPIGFLDCLASLTKVSSGPAYLVWPGLVWPGPACCLARLGLAGETADPTRPAPSQRTY